MNDLIDRLRTLTGRSPLRVPVPGFLGVLGARAAGLLGLHVPLDGGQVQMLEEGNLIAEPARNALISVFGIAATPLDEGLRRLCDSLPEQQLEEGKGSLVRRHVWADIVGSRLGRDALFERFRALFGEITLEQGRVQQSNFPSYEMVRLAQTPEIEVHIVNSGVEHLGGIGEVGTPPVAPAVCNALFAVTGKRIRELPIRL